VTEPKRGCLTCKWADYLKTPTGRRKLGSVVRCNFPMPTADEIRKALRALYPASVPLAQIREYGPFGMWPNEPSQDGSDCTKWEPKE
jgi:hypothetical protein